MRKSMCMVLSVLIAGMPVYAMQEITRNHIVTKAHPIAYGKYIVQSEDSVWVLNTQATTDKFEAGEGRITVSKKHGIMWKIPLPESLNNNEVLVKAKSPLIQGGEGSYVFVTGKFQNKVPDGGAAGGGDDGGGDDNPDKPSWSSQLKEPAVHVILVHLYTLDTTLQTSEWAEALNGCAAQLEVLYDGDGDVVHIVTIGQGKDISSIAGLPAYLAGEGVSPGAVVTVDTLGHTRWAGDAGFICFLLQSANGPNSDYVMNSLYFGEDSDYIPKMATSTFCNYFKDYLKPEAFIGLYHCETARPYLVTPAPPHEADSLLVQVLKILGPARQACGVEGFVYLPANDRPSATGSFRFGGLNAP